MEAIRSGLVFLFILVILVVVHEWGHFIVAKLCKMRVEDFSIFFGKRLIRLGERNGTEYNIRSIPLGGFVKITGMEPDDISNGTPLFRKRGERHAKILRGLRPEMLAEINAENVSDRVLDAVAQSVGFDGTLTSNGKAELQTLVLSAAINADEHRYLEAALAAGNYTPDSMAYNQKPLWQRAAVIFAGPLMSFLFGYFIFCAMGLTTGLPESMRTENVVHDVVPNKPAARAGLKSGDRIVQIGNTVVNDGKSMVEVIRNNIGTPLRFNVQRDGQLLNFTITPEAELADVEENGKIVKKSVGRIGFAPRSVMVWKRPDSAWQAVTRGTEIVYFQVYMTMKTLSNFKQAKENASGIIGIGKQIHEDRKEGPRQLLLTSAFLSVSLGIFNLLPIPVLDGGHLLLLGWEGLRRRKLSTREVYSAQMLGLSIILVLFVLVLYNDITRIILKIG